MFVLFNYFTVIFQFNASFFFFFIILSINPSEKNKKNDKRQQPNLKTNNNNNMKARQNQPKPLFTCFQIYKMNIFLKTILPRSNGLL